VGGVTVLAVVAAAGAGGDPAVATRTAISASSVGQVVEVASVEATGDRPVDTAVLPEVSVAAPEAMAEAALEAMAEAAPEATATEAAVEATETQVNLGGKTSL